MALEWVQIEGNEITDPFGTQFVAYAVPITPGRLYTGRVKLEVLKNTWVPPGPYSVVLLWRECYESCSGFPAVGDYVNTYAGSQEGGWYVTGYVGYGYPQTMPGTVEYNLYAEADVTPPPVELFWTGFVGSAETETL